MGLSETQKADISECKKNLEWLVRDEIASAMRNTGPVSEKTLKMVAEHVKSSEQKETCRYHREPLHYVFGPKESHGMFVEVRKVIIYSIQISEHVCGKFLELLFSDYTW